MNDDEKKKLPLLPNGKPNISFSELSTWARCPWAHKLQNIDKIETYRQNPHAEFGTAVHASNEDFLKTRVMKPQIALQKIVASWEKYKDAIDENGKKSFVDIDDWLTQAASILLEVPQFMDDTYPNWEYVSAEHQLFEPFPTNEGDYRFKGFIDGVIRCDPKRGKKKVTWLIDWKTSTRGWDRYKRQDAAVLRQLVFYKHFWSQITGEELKNIRCSFVILKRLAKVSQHIDFFPVSVGETSIARALPLTRDMCASMKKGTFVKNRFGCKWCDFWGTEHCDSWTKLY